MLGVLVVDGKFIQAITSTLNYIIAPYEGRGEFGNLRKSNIWEEGTYEFLWKLIYEKRNRIGKRIWFDYEASASTFRIFDDNNLRQPRVFATQDSGDAFERLKRRIEEIPLEP